ncbi:FG-GAP repeat domain-containing protein [Shimia ponticola]|uniref:FG-GAP repeat domain-containing protein n=1 Tax=Shimia ponticola TaxID=2582893 RepID=UPI0021054612|nr:VCBS repeat-containing protein [Shimia ponticola]
MLGEAPRLLYRLWRGLARGAALTLVCVAGGAVASPIESARYMDPTDRYPHAVLGDAIEYETLEVTFANGDRARLKWPDQIVFEDTEPRLADIDDDGSPEVIVTESHERQGARVAIYAGDGDDLIQIAATPFIGTRFRWLGIVGAADLDGDEAVEIAYVDRPHLAKTLRVWRVSRSDAETVSLKEIASLPGVTNHRIGEDYISGGIRVCDGRPEMLVANANWTRVLAVELTASGLTSRDIGPFTGRASLDPKQATC